MMFAYSLVALSAAGSRYSRDHSFDIRIGVLYQHLRGLYARSDCIFGGRRRVRLQRF